MKSTLVVAAIGLMLASGCTSPQPKPPASPQPKWPDDCAVLEIRGRCTGAVPGKRYVVQSKIRDKYIIVTIREHSVSGNDRDFTLEPIPPGSSQEVGCDQDGKVRFKIIGCGPKQ
jgi:hypothetical protein